MPPEFNQSLAPRNPRWLTSEFARTAARPRAGVGVAVGVAVAVGVGVAAGVAVAVGVAVGVAVASANRLSRIANGCVSKDVFADC